MSDTIKEKHQFLLTCLLLALVTLAVFWQVKDHEFVDYDDQDYVTENPHVQAGLTFQNIKWAFTTSHAANWHPLTWLSHMLDCRLFGLNPAGHHLMNLFFHLANTLLLFLVLHRMTKALWQCAFVAALFALHPLHVESVAWVAERKDVLSTFFWMLTMGAYVHYVERPGIRRYSLALAFFILGLMSKPMLVTLPFVLLLLDYWPLGRLQPAAPDSSQTSGQKNPGRKKRKAAKGYTQDTTQQKQPGFLYRWPLIYSLVREKVPFFAFSAISSVITFFCQQPAMAPLDRLPLNVRMGNALLSYVKYMVKMIWPQDLAFFYPHLIAPPGWQVFGAVLALVIITSLAIGGVKRFPCLVVGWFWFLGTLVPVIGLVQVGGQAMADRYTYVPFVGLFIMLAWGVPELLNKWQYPTPINGIRASTKLTSAGKRQKIISNVLITTLATAAGSILLVFAIVTWRQVQYWQDGVTLFSHALTATKNNHIAHYSLGLALHKKGNNEEVIGHFREAIRIKPRYAAAYMNLGIALFQKGNIEEAIANYMEAIHINPNYGDAYNNMGNALFSQGKIGEADSYLREALRIKPDFAEAHYNLGSILASQGMLDDAVTHFQEAIRIIPGWAKVHNNLGSVLLLQGKIDEAVVHFQEALRIQPDYAMAQDNLRDALRLQREKK